MRKNAGAGKGPILDWNEVSRLPRGGIVLLAAAAVERVLHILWGSQQESQRWITAVKRALEVAEELASDPQRATTSAFRKKTRHLFAEIDELTHDASLSAEPAVRDVLQAGHYLAAAIEVTGEIAELYGRGEVTKAEGKGKTALRCAARAIEKTVQAAPRQQGVSIAAELRKMLAALRQATSARRDDEERLHTLQPVRRQDFGTSLHAHRPGPGSTGAYTDSIYNVLSISDLLRPSQLEFQALEQELAKHLAPFRKRFEDAIAGLNGATVDSYEQKAALVAQINRLRQQLQLQFSFRNSMVSLYCVPGQSGRGTGKFQLRDGTKALYGKVAFPQLACVPVTHEPAAKSASS